MHATWTESLVSQSRTRVVEKGGAGLPLGRSCAGDGICSGLEGQVNLTRAELSRHRPMHEPRSLLERAGWWAVWG